jgi:hypothetical protein
MTSCCAFGSSLWRWVLEFPLKRPLTNLRTGFSCWEDDESGALGAELLREALGVRKLRAQGQCEGER